MLSVSSWQYVAWHDRRSYWELDEAARRDLRGAMEAEAADCARRVEAALEEYAALPDTQEGQLFNADLLATLLPSLRRNPTQGFEALEDPAGRAAVHLNALGKAPARPGPSETAESVVAYQLQTAFLSPPRNPTHDPQAYYPRDVLAELNRTLTPWRRS